jgi:hypothetical protein
MRHQIALNLNSGTYKSSLVKPFESAQIVPKTEKEYRDMFIDNSKLVGQEPTSEAWHKFMELIKEEENKPIFQNDTYQVSAGRADPSQHPMVHLSVKRLDKEPIDENHWRILQEIKNIIVGPDHEAVELYPAESRLMDTANQYHLWVLAQPAEDRCFPFGYFTQRAVFNREDTSYGAKQRPRHDAHEDND